MMSLRVDSSMVHSSSAEMAYLTRSDPTRNLNRFYVVQVTPEPVRPLDRYARMRPARLTRYPAARNVSPEGRTQLAAARTIQRRLQCGYRDPTLA